MRIVFIGCVEFSHRCLTRLLELPEVELAGVVTRRASGFNTDFRGLAPLAERHGLPCILADETEDKAVADWIRARRPDAVYCLGWSHLLPAELLRVPPLGVIGYHPALLPRHRGRHPIIWAIALGLQETGSTFFLMDTGADSGPIVSQRTVPIEPDDDAGSLYRRLAGIALEQLVEFTPLLAAGALMPRPQEAATASYWRKRSPADGRIDWRMGARSIHNLVRALRPPYPGATCSHAGREAIIWRTEPLMATGIGIEPGKVLWAEGDSFEVQCGEGSIRILEHTLEAIPAEGEYL